MNIAYVKIQSNETKKGIDRKLSFSGSLNGLIYELKISGDNDLIQDFIQKQRLQHFGQNLQLDIKNEQMILEGGRR
jgi:hypothetical protein